VKKADNSTLRRGLDDEHVLSLFMSEGVYASGMKTQSVVEQYKTEEERDRSEGAVGWAKERDEGRDQERGCKHRQARLE
jgi:hypothetical protein